MLAYVLDGLASHGRNLGQHALELVTQLSRGQNLCLLLLFFGRGLGGRHNLVGRSFHRSFHRSFLAIGNSCVSLFHDGGQGFGDCILAEQARLVRILNAVHTSPLFHRFLDCGRHILALGESDFVGQAISNLCNLTLGELLGFSLGSIGSREPSRLPTGRGGSEIALGVSSIHLGFECGFLGFPVGVEQARKSTKFLLRRLLAGEARSFYLGNRADSQIVEAANSWQQRGSQFASANQGVNDFSQRLLGRYRQLNFHSLFLTESKYC